jgi:4'-phosphopantetheinyl transferase
MPIGSTLIDLDGVLQEDEIHVWHTDLGLEEEAVNRLTHRLDSAEQARAGRFLVDHARKQYVISHAFLRAVLAKYVRAEPLALRFSSSKNGKPALVDGDGLCFNLSHTEGTAAMAIARKRRVGIDVEKVRDNLKPLELATRFFSPQECKWLRSHPIAEQLAAFFACWTAKESYIKAVGEGLSMGLAGFAVIPKNGNAKLQLEIFDQPEESERWLIWQLNLKPDLCAAVAAESGDVTVRIGEWHP